MAKRINKNPRAVLVCLIVVCMVLIGAGAFYYISMLRTSLAAESVQDVLAVTKQQRQAFDAFIQGDRDRLHSFAEYFSGNEHDSPEDVRKTLTLFNELDASYSVFCLDEGWYCVTASDQIQYASEEELEIYNALDDSGIRDPFTSIFSGTPKFAIYEKFTFANGHRGLIQKAYDRDKVSETFSRSFYDGQGLAYVVNSRGDILLRSVGKIGDIYYDNIFQILSGNYEDQEAIDAFAEALQGQEEGSMTFTGEKGSFIYTYAPVESVDGWYLVSIVPEKVISAEADELLVHSQLTFIFMVLVLGFCLFMVMLIWRTHRDLSEKDQAIEYQERVFDIFPPTSPRARTTYT